MSNHRRQFAGPKDGILHVTVNLAEGEGRVLYDTTKHDGEEIAEMIDDMGYDCSLISVVGACFSIHFKALTLKEHFRH